MYRWYKYSGRSDTSTSPHSGLFAIITSMISGHMGEYKIQQYPFNLNMNNNYYEDLNDAMLDIVNDMKHHGFYEIELRECSQFTGESNLIYYWYSLSLEDPIRELPYCSPRYPKLKEMVNEPAHIIVAKIKRAIYHFP